MKIILLVIAAHIILIGGIYYGVGCYRKSKCEETIKNTNVALMDLNQRLSFAVNNINLVSNILVVGEKENLNDCLNASKEKIDPVKKEIEEALSLEDVQQVRAKLEPDFEAGYVTPIHKIANIKAEVEVVINFCNNRKELRDRAYENEMTMKAVLKKPIEDSIELPSDVSGMPAKFLAYIPRKNNPLVGSLASLEPPLNNSMGIALLGALPTLENVKKIAKTDAVKQHAQNLWNSAKSHFMNVQPNNDKVHWYVPKDDDGKYNSEDYQKLLGMQKTALDAWTYGNNFIGLLNEYNDIVKNQYVVYISKNDYESTSFSHSRQVRVTKTRRDKDGNRVTYTDTETEYYRTEGRKFFYTKTTITLSGMQHQRIEVGSKDSYWHIAWSWRDWDYKPDEREGYLVEYKEFGLDNSSIVRGGLYNPAVHVLKQ